MKKFFSKLFCFSHGKRLTLYFILFGLILGYVIFLLTTMITIHNATVFLGSIINKHLFNEILTSDEKDMLLNINNPEYTRTAANVNFFFSIKDEIDLIDSVKLIYFDTDKKQWMEIVNDSKTINDFTMKPYEGDTSLLKHSLTEKAQEKTFTLSFMAEFKKNELLMLNLSKPIDKNRYFIMIHLKKQNFIAFAKKNKFQFIAFDLFVIIISALLGNKEATGFYYPV